jgi:Tetratricopeptide repeat
MKKIILIIATLGLCFQGMAQEKYVVSANVALNKQNFEEAKENIDKAMASPETKEKPKALLAKAMIYISLQGVEKYKATNPYREGTQALFKLIELKPDYERSSVDQLLAVAAYLYYNDGAKAYNDKKLDEAAECMKNVVKIHNMDGGKRFDKLPEGYQKKMDTVAAAAGLTLGNSSYYLGKYEESIPLLTAAKNNPISRSPSVYECLIDALNRQKNTTEAFAVIQEARKNYPDDATIRNFELNYYISNGKQDEILKKLEEAAAKDPNNADIQFNIATTYLGMAIPKGPKPPNSADLLAKSEAAFTQTLKLAPDNAVYNYNFGALYFNQAIEFNDQMNAITGTSDADQKKYDALKAKRDGLFVKANVYFEKTYTILSANEKGLKKEEKDTYMHTLTALQQIYSMQSKMDKAKEMKTKLESMN